MKSTSEISHAGFVVGEVDEAYAVVPASDQGDRKSLEFRTLVGNHVHESDKEECVPEC
jgi:hypothetical protein